MKQIIFYLLAMLWSAGLGYGQVVTIKTGEYSHTSYRTYESIVLHPNQQFAYEFRQEFLHVKIKGTWALTNDSLLLNSVPQRDRMIVWGKYKKLRKNKYIFNVKNKQNEYFGYFLYLTDTNGQTKELKGQWKQSKILLASKLKSFFIVNSSGVTSSVYTIGEEYSNVFDIIFERNRVFENEVWRVSAEGIRPIMFNGEVANYILTKQ